VANDERNVYEDGRRGSASTRLASTLSWSPGALSGSICRDAASDLNHLQHSLSTGVGIFSIDRSLLDRGLNHPFSDKRARFPFDPATNRMFTRFKDAGQLREAPAWPCVRSKFDWTTAPIVRPSSPARRRRLRRGVVAARRGR
jgi:hypothetical protein